jgi:glutamyl-tRNA synthetase
MSVIARFAPSPTGFLHIGGVRTALFNWLFARHHRGRFLLRIEDTDRVRSTPAAMEAIIDGLNWLGLDWDGPVVYQSQRTDRHAAAARELLARGNAYLCYATPEELEAMRAQARAEGRAVRYDGRWRDRDPASAPPGVAPAIRLKARRDGETVIHDLVQGPVRVANEQLDDMVLLRADGTPTYMLAVVIDDHDMDISHVIRGDDHLTNAFRQQQIYEAFGWKPPQFAHIPLIHGADGAKLSKRHGALGVDAYRDLGYLPEAVENYLLRLGWSHGDDEIISREEAIRWFNLEAVGRSPARFDCAKLTSLNAHYIRVADDKRLMDWILPQLHHRLDGRMSALAADRIAKGLPALKARARSLIELADAAAIYACDGAPAALPPPGSLSDGDAANLAALSGYLAGVDDWTAAGLESAVRAFAAAQAGLPLRTLAQPLRLVLTGSAVSPPVFQVMEILGAAETQARIGAALSVLCNDDGDKSTALVQKS